MGRWYGREFGGEGILTKAETEQRADDRRRQRQA